MPSDPVTPPPRRPPRGRFIAALALASVALAWLVASSPLFDVRRVRVSGNERLNPREVVTLARVGAGANLLALSLEEVEGALSRSPWVASASVDRSLPWTLVIRIREREPVGWVRDPSGIAVVAGDGVILQHRPRPPRTLMGLGVWGRTLHPGETLRGLRATWSVAASLPPELRTEVAAIRLVRGEVRLELSRGGSVRYGAAVALGAKNAALASILDWAEDRGADLAEIDLRAPRTPAVRELP